MKELIEELEYNDCINYFEGLENRIDIDYMIERVKDVKNDLEKYINKRIKFLDNMIDYYLESNEQEALKYMYARQEIQAIKNIIESGQDEKIN